MRRIGTSKLMIAAVLTLPSCDDSSAGKSPDASPNEIGDGKRDDAQASAQSDDAPAAETVTKKEDEDPWQETLAARVLADSGLGIGGKLSAFQIVNAESGKEYCQVCSYGPNPKVMAVGEATDEAFKEDLKNLDAIVAKYGEDKVKAFAVVTDFAEGKAVTPSDPEASKQKAKALKDELGISMPVVIPAPKGGGSNRVWDEYYNITSSRTIMFANGRNEVQWNAVGPKDFSGLSQAIEKTIGG